MQVCMALYVGKNVQELVCNLHCDEWDGNRHALDNQVILGIT